MPGYPEHQGARYHQSSAGIRIEPQVVDPWADKELVKQEYGVELKEWSEIQNADCVIHAVAHGEFRDRGLEGVGSLMGTERSKKILLDIKGEWSVDALNKSGLSGGECKKQTEKSWIFLGLAAGVLVMSAGIWGLFFMNKSYSPNAKAYVDGRIETGDSEIDKAYEKFFLSEPAELIQDQKENPEKTIRILFRGLNEDVNVNEVVLKRLEETGIKASFALSAAETLENKDYVARMLKAGQELVSNGTDGSGNLQSREVREMIEDMLTSREAISTGADVAVPLLYCDSEVTAELLNAAAVSGYEALVDPNEDRVITDDTFSSREEIEKEIDSLQGQTILVFDLRGNGSRRRKRRFMHKRQ